MASLSVVNERSRGASGGSPREDWLVTRIRARDLRAFEELYRNYHPRLTRFLMNMVHRPQLVEEVFNDTMMVVWEKLDGFNGSSKLSTWIFAIGYRKAMKAVRRQDQAVEDKEAENRVSPEPGPDHRIGGQKVQAALLGAINGLSADHRAVVDLTYYHELGYREIAEIMDCPVDTVKTRMFHARRHLKRKLAGELADWL
ncbi:RNA polymerase sigma factor [Sphingomonas oligoaromativorans]|uniref:RNA polymerase sigma factor n=1 Tax=Sphingomonas oligoaromativorans TaxID=575322 RepID=UPI0031329AE2|nr:RNA polymerase sigma-70 factor (ECF subfamily) [Sphingomonas oligoaromativorans]